MRSGLQEIERVPCRSLPMDFVPERKEYLPLEGDVNGRMPADLSRIFGLSDILRGTLLK